MKTLSACLVMVGVVVAVGWYCHTLTQTAGKFSGSGLPPAVAAWFLENSSQLPALEIVQRFPSEDIMLRDGTDQERDLMELWRYAAKVRTLPPGGAQLVRVKYHAKNLSGGRMREFDRAFIVRAGEIILSLDWAEYEEEQQEIDKFVRRIEEDRKRMEREKK